MHTPALEPERYIADRVEQYRAWYDKKAVGSKAAYLRGRAFTVIAGGIVPVLINLDLPYKIGKFSVVTLVVTLLSLMVVITVSLETVFHYREQWKNYRSTEQLLGHEVFWFRAGVGRYANLSADEAFLAFVERVEDTIAAENSATLNVMTTAAEAAQDSNPRKRE